MRWDRRNHRLEKKTLMWWHLPVFTEFLLQFWNLGCVILTFWLKFLVLCNHFILVERLLTIAHIVVVLLGIANTTSDEDKVLVMEAHMLSLSSVVRLRLALARLSSLWSLLRLTAHVVFSNQTKEMRGGDRMEKESDLPFSFVSPFLLIITTTKLSKWLWIVGYQNSWYWLKYNDWGKD